MAHIEAFDDVGGKDGDGNPGTRRIAVQEGMPPAVVLPVPRRRVVDDPAAMAMAMAMAKTTTTRSVPRWRTSGSMIRNNG